MTAARTQWVLLTTVFIAWTLGGCAADNDSDREIYQTLEREIEDVEVKVTTEMYNELESGDTTVPETETASECYGPVKVSELDYDSFRSRMTDEEWEGIQQYFPVLRENAPFYIADFGDSIDLNKDGEPASEDDYVLYTRYVSGEVMDIDQYINMWKEDIGGECLIRKVSVFDLDGDGVQELILETSPGTFFLILHREKEDFYGWQVAYRGFEALQTNGVYIGSSGAGANCWNRIQFDQEGWLEECLAEEYWGEYYLHGEAVDEAAFLMQTEVYWTEDVTGYEP